MEKVAQHANGAVWKWICAGLLSIVMFQAGLIAGDGLASWRLGEDLRRHEEEGQHNGQEAWNAGTEQRLLSVESATMQIPQIRESLVRIETNLGIRQENR